MTTKKSVALIIVLMMVLSALAGCSSTKTNTPGEATKAPASVEENAETSADKTPDGETSAEREHATFSLLNMSAATTTVDPWKDTPVGKYLAEKTNVDLEIEYLVGSDVRQKASLLIAAGEYPDMMTTADASGDFKAAGAFIPLNDYIANSTNMKDCFTNSQMKLMTQEDGNIYWFGSHASENAVYPSAGYYLNMDLLKQADYPEVKYFDQWQQLIIDYVAANPTYNGQSTIGVSEPTEAWRASAVQYGGSRFLVGYQNDGLTIVNPDTLEAKVIMDQDFQKEFCKMLNTMWNLGIADPEEFLTHYNAQTFCDWFNPSYNAMYEPGWSIRQRIDTTDPRKIAGETALEITLEYVPKLAQCKPEEFDNVWNEFAGKLADLPLREYEALATEMLQAGAENYK